MITLTVDGSNFPVNPGSVKTIAELVELVKASIDPESIITSVVIDGNELTESDWRVPLSVHGNSAVAINSGSRMEYVHRRMETAPIYVERIGESFLKSANLLRNGDITGGNTEYAKAVGDFKAFVSWYDTLLKMMPVKAEGELEKYNATIRDITDVCEQLVQQQLYKAWWAIADTVEKRLLPELSALRTSCIAIYDGESANDA